MASLTADPALQRFTAPVSRWFSARFPEGPTEPQRRGWQEIEAGNHTLIAAPTGSGKTLAALLLALDRAYARQLAGNPPTTTTLLYVSPLRALASDIRENLLLPLQEIAATAVELGIEPPHLTVGLRTGDTSQAQRRALLKRPPTFLITTPESLYLLLTTPTGRHALEGVQTVVVDEIHALLATKRGDHLALSLERLQSVVGGPLQRVGLSATQKPLARSARLLAGRRPVSVVDCGWRRPLDLSIGLPKEELGAHLSAAQLGELADLVAAGVEGVRTALVFVNTRRFAERFAHLLAERLPPGTVLAHHGSLSLPRRRQAEAALRAGELKALVATASLELGIDVGPVELVYQLGSPRLISAFLQRAGRANHSRHGRPRAVLLPLSRDDLAECVALVAAVGEGRLEHALDLPPSLEIVAQQVVAEVAARGEVGEDRLLELLRAAGPCQGIPEETLREVVTLLCEGVETGRGRRLAYLHADRIGGVIRARRGARLTALQNGGAIPEEGDYRVVLEGEGTVLGEVNEDFALESMVGDVFLLGTHSWRVVGVRGGEVRVVDAGGANPTIPFWFGEAPGRSRELSLALAKLRRGVVRRLLAGGPQAAVRWLVGRHRIDPAAAQRLVSYLHCAQRQLGVVPTVRDVVFERFFDEAGGMQLVVHAPFGMRINRAWALALRKRFCVTFDFELQAAANDDGLLLSLGPQHSFPLADAAKLLPACAARPALEQAVLASPIFSARWRHVLNRFLAVERARSGKRVPVAIQRMEAEDLLAAVFPALAACQENAPPGPIPIPNHPLVAQALRDCLEEALDLPGLERVLKGIERGLIRTHFVDSVEPSVVAHELLEGRPYTFLDEAPLEERRSRNVFLRRGLDHGESLQAVLPEAVAEVRAAAAPKVRDREDLHRLLLDLVVAEPLPDHQPFFASLASEGRAAVVRTAAGEVRWAATERLPWAFALLAGAEGEEGEQGLAAALRGHLAVAGPTTTAALAARLGLPEARVESGLAALEGEGYALRGKFLGREEEWCSRPLLFRIHAATRRRRRQAFAIPPLDGRQYLSFLLRWQGHGPLWSGVEGVAKALGQLQGLELPAASWEGEVLPARIKGFAPDLLDELCRSGEFLWGRFRVREMGDRGIRFPSRTTPVGFARREELGWLLAALRGGEATVPPTVGAAAAVYAALAEHGALFVSELCEATGRLQADVEQGLFELVLRGLATADSFRALRALYATGSRVGRRAREGGRWSLLQAFGSVPSEEELAERVARQLALRWGVVFRDLYYREPFRLAWRVVLAALRRLEARGELVGGRFVLARAGEQFLLPEARELLLAARHQRPAEVTVAGADPLNLSGVLFQTPRQPARLGTVVNYTAGSAQPLLPRRSAGKAAIPNGRARLR